MLLYRHFREKMGRSFKNIVLDIDECLTHTHDSDGIYDYEKNDRRVMIVPVGEDTMVSYQRPGLRKFLSFCNDFFDNVVIWSAGTADYVRAITKKIFWGLKPPALVLTRDDCVYTSNGTYYKPLSKVYAKLPECNEKNTFIIDDRAMNFLVNRRNGLTIPPYTPPRTEEGVSSEDDALQKITKWLHSEDVYRSKDIRNVKYPTFQ